MTKRAYKERLYPTPEQAVLLAQSFGCTRARYPRFKRKDGWQSIRLTKAAFRYRDGEITIAKSKVPLPIRWSRPLPSSPSSITISQDRTGRYFISCLCEVEIATLPIIPKMTGIDLGLTDLFITSDGAKSGNPRHLKHYEAKLAYLQRQLAKKQKGSNNRAKLRRKVARLHAKIADCRRDAIHKATRTLVNENQVLCIESLNIVGMVKNRHLAKAISDAGWGEFVHQLEYKATWAGRKVVKVSQWFPSSKLCHGCGQAIDRDINAAKNIRTAGLAGLACGATGARAAA